MNKQILKKIVSIIGLMVPISFVTSFAILVCIHPNTLNAIQNLSFFGYNIEGISYQNLISYFNYFTVGTLITLFSVGLILLLPQSFTNNLGSLFLLITGLLWSSLAFFTASEDDGLSDYVLIALIIIFIASCFSQLILSNDIYKLVRSKIVKKLLFVAGILVILEFGLCIFVPNFIISIPIFSMVFLILNIGILGYHLSKDYDFIDSE